MFKNLFETGLVSQPGFNNAPLLEPSPARARPANPCVYTPLLAPFQTGPHPSN
jgi:hypothetical protein